MKKMIILAFLCALIASCGVEKYSDLRDDFKKEIKAFNGIVKAGEKISSSEDYISFLDKNRSQMEKFKSIENIYKKRYPEITPQSEPPEILKETFKDMQKVQRALAMIMQKNTSRFINNEDVKNALKEYSRRLDELNK